MTIEEAKKQAKARLSGHWGITILFEIIISIISGILSSFGLGMLLLGSLLTISTYYFYIHINEAKIEFIAEGFKEGLGQRVVLSALKTIFIALWYMLFIIPGIIKRYAYSLAEMIAMANPEKGGEECIKESNQAMNGEKWDLFMLDLSFIGWYLLSMLTLGILLFYVVPYHRATKVEYLYALASEKGYYIGSSKAKIEADEPKEENK